MSCLPLFSFGQTLPAAFKSSNASSDPSQKDLWPPTHAIARHSNDEVDDRYDKLARVSVSHRRVDSFEWVMTQSAPNTPPTLNSKYEPYSPPPVRRVGSAPLPVPHETWSTSSQPLDGRQKRGYFDWFSSPILGFNQGYTKVPATEPEDHLDSPESLSATQTSTVGLSQPFRPHAGTQTPTSPYSDCDEVQPMRELNALGIVFPCTPPSSPPSPDTQRALDPRSSPGSAAQRLPKHVSFSPVVTEAAAKTFSECDSTVQPSTSWGSYLPSSFLVARPSMTRTMTSPPVSKTIATRPILKRSTSYQPPVRQGTSSTEMVRISRKHDAGNKAIAVSPIPTQRLSTGTSHADGHRIVGDKSGETDSAFVAMLHVTQKPARQRCDSLLSNASLSVDNGSEKL